MSQFCGSGLRSRSKVTSAAEASDVPANSVASETAVSKRFDAMVAVPAEFE